MLNLFHSCIFQEEFEHKLSFRSHYQINCSGIDIIVSMGIHCVFFSVLLNVMSSCVECHDRFFSSIISSYINLWCQVLFVFLCGLVLNQTCMNEKLLPKHTHVFWAILTFISHHERILFLWWWCYVYGYVTPQADVLQYKIWKENNITSTDL